MEEDSLQNIESEGMGSIAHLKRKTEAGDTVLKYMRLVLFVIVPNNLCSR